MTEIHKWMCKLLKIHPTYLNIRLVPCVMPLTIPVPGTWQGFCINRANEQVCTCMKASKPKPRARGLTLWVQHSGLESLESCVMPCGCELDSKGTVQHHLLTCTVFHTAVDQVTVANFLFLTSPVSLEVVSSCPMAYFAVHASNHADGTEWLGQHIAPLQFIFSLRMLLKTLCILPFKHRVKSTWSMSDWRISKV